MQQHLPDRHWIAKVCDVLVLVALLASLVALALAFGPRPSHAASTPTISWSRVSLAAGVQWTDFERADANASPLLAHRPEWGVAVPLAYNLPSPAKHPLALTYSCAYGFSNRQFGHTFRLSYVFKKGGD